VFTVRILEAQDIDETAIYGVVTVPAVGVVPPGVTGACTRNIVVEVIPETV
jgi:hypothetical protein